MTLKQDWIKRMQSDDLISLTCDIVAAHASNNQVPAYDVGRLIGVVHQSLASLGQPMDPDPVEKTPSVSIRSSVKDEYLVCLVCGARQKTLKRHLMTAHRMLPDTYRADYGLPDSYPMTAPAYSRTRADIARSIRLGRPIERSTNPRPLLSLKFGSTDGKQ